MENKIKRPLTPKIKYLGLTKMFGGFNDIKKLSTGLGSGIVIGDNLSYDIKPAYLTFKPSQDPYYVYARLPKRGKEGTLELHRQPMYGTENDYMVLIKEGTFENLQFDTFEVLKNDRQGTTN